MPASRPGKVHFQPRSLGLHLAAGRLVFRPDFANFFRLPGQIHVRARAAGNHQRRVPERVPLFPLHHLWRELHIQLFQRCDLLLGEPSDTAGDLEFGSQILPEHDPASAVPARRKFAHQGLPPANRKLSSQLFPALALPRDFQNAGANLRLQSLLRFIARQVARQILAYACACRHGG